MDNTKCMAIRARIKNTINENEAIDFDNSQLLPMSNKLMWTNLFSRLNYSLDATNHLEFANSMYRII